MVIGDGTHFSQCSLMANWGKLGALWRTFVFTLGPGGIGTFFFYFLEADLPMGMHWRNFLVEGIREYQSNDDWRRNTFFSMFSNDEPGKIGMKKRLVGV
ncbi:hypothetical protein CEXT_208781 [Caerostris extrusa]|uniref:Uncharacterized protein n=1 Tax=Caerostris extrusa TaxID=172846 RepID=A0AAV4M8G3_CAEEX|nr:hypothetical protein CEXT_208781 [Caerostris extrusa]